MKLEQPKNKEFKKELLEDGSYAARVYSVIDLGTQTTMYNGEEKQSRKIEISFEIPSETITYEKDGEEITSPRAVHKKYNVSMFEKSLLYPVLKAGFGKVEEGQDPLDLIGKEMMISVSQKTFIKDGTPVEYNSVDMATALPKGMTVEAQINDSIRFDLEHFDADVFNGLPDWTKETISKSPEMKAITGEEGKVKSEADKQMDNLTEDDNDVPFPNSK